MKRIYILIISIIALSFYGALAQDLTGIRIHINPGHGGWDSDDRGISTPLIEAAANQGFWESQSNLDKGLQLRDMLEALGATVQMSRVQNRTEDDLPLSTIVAMANEFQADFMLSIHSNAGAGTANYVLMLYAGISDGDTHTYPTPTPNSDESKAISTEIAKNLIKNQITHWTSPNYNVSGDKTYARLHMGWSNGYGVLRGLTVPGVISEGSMHDYIPETYRLMNMEYKWLEAWNFKKAFCTYFKGAEIPTGNIAGWVKDSRNLLLDGTYKKYAKDMLLPLDGAKITVIETGETYTVDNNRNGVYVFKDLQPNTYTLKIEAEGYYAQEQQVTVYKNEITYFNFELNKIRNTAPEVIEYSPNVPSDETVEASTDIVLKFNWDMDEESTRNAFSISPAVEGTLTFEDSQHLLRFTPHFPLEKSTLYTVKLDKSAKHPDNISMTEDFTFQFTTKDRNRLILLENYPNDGNNGVYATKPLFMFIFDKKLDSSTIRDEINVYDSEGKEFSKASRSVKINKTGEAYGDIYFELTEALTAGKNYTVKIGANAKDEAGIKVTDPIEINFTASNVVVTDKTIIDDFETSGKYTYDESQSVNTLSASMVRSTSQKLFGASSYLLKTVFSDSDASTVFTVFEPLANTGASKVFGLHVYGDMSGNEMQLQFTYGADVRYIKLCDLTFYGWEFVETQFTESDDEYLFTGIRIVRKDGILSQSSVIYVDNLLQYSNSSGFTPLVTNKNIRTYPNPASDIVYVKTTSDEVPVLQLYSLGGYLLKEVKALEISVENLLEGTYILHIKTDKEVLCTPIIVSK